MIDIHHGDSRAILPTLPDASVDAVVTDPPYELGFMGKTWDGSGIAYDVELWRECLRVLKPGGHLLAFGGTRTYHRLVCAIEDAGFEVRDSLHWVYGSGFPKSRNLAGDWNGWGTALKPAHEPIVLARKSLTGTVAGNVTTYGTGALNIDGCRVTGVVRQVTQGVTRAASEGYAVFGCGKDLRAEIGLSQPHAAGRWPTNALFGHGPECVDGGDCQPGCPVDDIGDPHRFFPVFRYQAKAPTRERPRLDDGTAHPTVKPLELMRWLVRLVTPPGGTVLDPFAGSGATLEAAALEGFRSIGVEQHGPYVEMCRVRMARVPGQRGA